MSATTEAEHVRGFRHRGSHDVSRIESFSDAVFGLSVTLLVVSLEVPRTFDDLLHALARFPSFALTFALLAQIWFLQYRFFRRYALHDGITILLNLVLLFVVVFFTYPLKFLFTLAVSSHGVGEIIREDQLATMYAVYALGYVAVFAIFWLLYAHALSKRDQLELTPLEVFDTRRDVLRAIFQICIAAASAGAAAIFNARGDYANVALFGGLAYALIPLGIGIIGISTAARRRQLEGV